MTVDRRWILAAVLTLIGVPGVVALIGAVSFQAANRSNRTMVVAGQEREYLLYVPASLDRTRPAPLVISLHGAGLWGAAQREISQWNRVADRERFLVVYPSGAPGAGPRVWHLEANDSLPQDVRFIAALIDTLAAQFDIDRTRIYADGLSNGGGMAFALSCTLSDRIAAVGLVGPALTLPWRWCTDRHPIPAIWFHGTADRAAPYHGGTSLVAPTEPFPSIPAFVAKWAQRNRCGATPQDSSIAADITRSVYTQCADDATVVLYTIRGGGHTWPGGGPLPDAWVGPTNREIDATSLIWAFFCEHPLGAGR
ncbi:MAG TPA: PHB depolymerase family esterase [Gemmatimonadales bacterium]|nr:PHB depolymerase family esterase [Gemmatimonadales bacterium]